MFSFIRDHGVSSQQWNSKTNSISTNNHIVPFNLTTTNLLPATIDLPSLDISDKWNRMQSHLCLTVVLGFITLVLWIHTSFLYVYVYVWCVHTCHSTQRSPFQYRSLPSTLRKGLYIHEVSWLHLPTHCKATRITGTWCYMGSGESNSSPHVYAASFTLIVGDYSTISTLTIIQQLKEHLWYTQIMGICIISTLQLPTNSAATISVLSLGRNIFPVNLEN